jgi:uncharacterized protein YwgA
MGSEEAVLAVIAASPGRQVCGKKRFHKITYLCSYCDVPIDARFHIRRFGVFSPEIAEALEVLSVVGDIDTHDEQVGPNYYFTKVFALPADVKPKSDAKLELVVTETSKHSTPLLEVASTIAHFRKEGLNNSDAITKTQQIKPSLSTPERIAASIDLLERFKQICASSHENRPAHT